MIFKPSHGKALENSYILQEFLWFHLDNKVEVNSIQVSFSINATIMIIVNTYRGIEISYNDLILAKVCFSELLAG